MSKFIRESLAGLDEYVPGEQPQDRKYIKLNTNESPYPPPARVAAALHAEEIAALRLYSDPESRLLKEGLARQYGVCRENVFVANGSDEILNFSFLAYGGHGAVFPDITYGFYRVFADLYGIQAEIVPLRADFSIDVDAFCGRDGLTVIANPNAPTGIALPLDVIEKIIASSRGVVLIDEAYVDFGAESAVRLIDKYDNLLVVQTFSKSRSMAGARLGYAFAAPALIADLEKIKYATNPYNVNRLTQAAGNAALDEAAHFSENCRKIAETRDDVKVELQKRGFTLTDSKANFLFAKSDRIDGKSFYLALKEKGVLVRHFDGERIREYNRITIGSRGDMETFLAVTDEILEEQK